MNEAAVVFVIDDDPSVRRALGRALKTAGFQVETFSSGEEFLNHDRPDAAACLVLDLRMPGLNGLELQQRLNEAHAGLPIVFITGHGDIPTSVKAMKAGAADFLPKPFENVDLFKAVRQAIARKQKEREARAEATAIRQRAESLTPREREVMELVVIGFLNKQVGHRLNVTEKTVKVHRAHVMSKMDAHSLAELVRMAGKLETQAAESP